MNKLKDTDNTLTGLNADNMIVAKSYIIYDIQQKANLDLFELKILDLYLGRINPFDPNSYTVTFSKKELENAFGVKQIKNFTQEALNRRLSNLFKGVTFSGTDNNGIIHDYTVSLFDFLDVYKNQKGKLELTLRCGFAARKYIFDLKGIKYFQYRIKQLLKLKSLHSYRLYIYLAKEAEIRRAQDPITWSISIENLKHLLCGDDVGHIYDDNFFTFNQKILDKAWKEITQNTELQYTYKPIIDIANKSRYSHVQFTVTSFDMIDEIKTKKLKKKTDDNTNIQYDSSNPSTDEDKLPINNIKEPDDINSSTDTTYETEDIVKNTVTQAYTYGQVYRAANEDTERRFIEFLMNYCKVNYCKTEFSYDQTTRLLDIIKQIPKNFGEIGQRVNPDEDSPIEILYLGYCHYFQHRYKDLYIVIKDRTISNLYSYFKAMLEQDIDSPKTV